MKLANAKAIELYQGEESGASPLACIAGCVIGCAATSGVLTAAWAAIYMY